MAGALRRTLALARAEVTRSRAGFGRRTWLLLISIALAGALVAPAALDQGLDFDRGLYRVAVREDSPLAPAVQGASILAWYRSADPFADVDAGRADLGLAGRQVAADDGDKGLAALAALEQAVDAYNYRRLRAEADLAAAFPVRVDVVYVPVASTAAGTGGTTAPPAIPEPTPPPPGGVSGGSGSGGSGGTGSDGGLPEETAPGGFTLLPPERDVATPATLAPPFPFRSLILAYLFLVPMNFIAQAYGGSAIAERLGRRGEAVLASPARTAEVLLGKALPYLALTLLVSSGLALALGGGWLAVLAMLPVGLAFLALEFLAAMTARSFRELTFLTVFISVLLTVYLFLPAVFADVHPVALVSPITLVVEDLRHQAVTIPEVLYATLPLTAFSLTVFLLAAGLHREEDMFHQKPVRAKVLDALALRVKGAASGFTLQVLLIPLVFVAELLVLTFLFAWSAPGALAFALLSVAVVEELFKAGPSYAALSRGVLPPRRALRFGALAGLGFFAAEKGFLLAAMVGLFNLPAGAAIFGVAPGAALAGFGLALLVAPLALHMVTATLTAWGARSGKQTFLASLLLAIVLHAAYNYTVIRLAGGVG